MGLCAFDFMKFLRCQVVRHARGGRGFRSLRRFTVGVRLWLIVFGGIRSAEILRYVAVRCHFSTNRRISQATPLEDDTAERQPIGALLLQYAGATSPSTEILP